MSGPGVGLIEMQGRDWLESEAHGSTRLSWKRSSLRLSAP